MALAGAGKYGRAAPAGLTIAARLASAQSGARVVRAPGAAQSQLMMRCSQRGSGRPGV